MCKGKIISMDFVRLMSLHVSSCSFAGFPINFRRKALGLKNSYCVRSSLEMRGVCKRSHDSRWTGFVQCFVYGGKHLDSFRRWVGRTWRGDRRWQAGRQAGMESVRGSTSMRKAIKVKGNRGVGFCRVVASFTFWFIAVGMLRCREHHSSCGFPVGLHAPSRASGARRLMRISWAHQYMLTTWR